MLHTGRGFARLTPPVSYTHLCQMLEALSTMLNAAMDRKHRPLIHLSEEMMYVDAYLFIIREMCIIDRFKSTLCSRMVPVFTIYLNEL